MGKRFEYDYEDDYIDRKRDKFSAKEQRRQAARKKENKRNEFFNPVEDGYERE